MGSHVSEVADSRDLETLVVPPVVSKELHSLGVTRKAKALFVRNLGSYVMEELPTQVHGIDVP